MTSRPLVFEIARWEFQRWFKWKDQIVTMAISLVLALVIWGGRALLSGDDEAAKVFVIGQEILSLELSGSSQVELRSASMQQAEQIRGQVGRGEADGLLTIMSVDEAELLVYKEPVWKSELAERLTQARTEIKFRELQLQPSQLADAVRPVALSVVIHEGGHRPASTAEKIAAGVIIGLMLFGVFTGVAYQFVAITGEKQIRITEMILSAVSPQQWIDGKILGVSAYALAFTLTTGLSIALFVLVSQAFGAGWTIPLEITSPFILLYLVLLALGGFLLWNTFLATISATVSDPNTSARGTFLLLPFIPVVFAMFAFKNPDSFGLQVLSLIPFASSVVLPARLVLTEVAWWHVPLALVLMVLTIWFFRTASGKIFRLGMLMHGKEPSFKEMLRWAREA